MASDRGRNPTSSEEAPPPRDREEAFQKDSVILVIEDDESTRDTTARILRLAGHAVRTAANGREALEMSGTTSS